MGVFYNKIIHPFLSLATGHKVFTNDPHLGVLIDAQEEDLIADEQFRIGIAYLEGACMLPKDTKKALSYFKKAAERGHAVAQLYMMRGCMKKCDDNNDEVMYWLQKAAEQGEPQALYNLAISYHRGDINGKVDIAKSNELFRQSAEAGYKAAFSRMAAICFNGDGVEKNLKIAKYWAWIDFINLQENDRENSLFSRLVEPEDIKGNTICGTKILADAAEAGERDAMNGWAGGLYGSGEIDQAVDLWQKAIEQKHPGAMCNLAFLLLEEDKQDYEQARQLFDKASKSGLAKAFYGLAKVHYQGLGVEKDVKKAWEYLEKAINKGDAASRFLLATMCLHNELQDILPDKVMRGMSYMELSAADKFKPALDFMGMKSVQN